MYFNYSFLKNKPGQHLFVGETRKQVQGDRNPKYHTPGINNKGVLIIFSWNDNQFSIKQLTIRPVSIPSRRAEKNN